MPQSGLMYVAYRPPVHPSQAHHPAEYVVMIDPQCYARWRADAAAVPIIDVLASSKDPILSLQHGQTGMKMRPSRQELAEFFGTEDAFTAAEFILRNGKLINAPSGGSIRSNYVNQGQ